MNPFSNFRHPQAELLTSINMARSTTIPYIQKTSTRNTENGPRSGPQRTGSTPLAGQATQDNQGNSNKKPERRGRPKKISDDVVQRMIQMVESSPGEVSWEDLGQAVGVEGVHLQTIRNYLVKEGYCKRTACQQRWLTRKSRETRVQYAISHQHWQNEWRSVLFSDVVHFGLGVSRKARVWNRRDEQLCDECLQSREEVDKYIFHCWAMVGYDYKSSLVFYGDGENSTLTQDEYISLILRPHLQPANAGKRIVLLEPTSGIYENSRTGRSAVQSFLESIQVPYTLNPPSSPDLNVVKDIFMLLKKRLQKRVISDESELRSAVLEEWDGITAKDINKVVDRMKGRMEKVIRRKGLPI
jgi:hypothetical protein